MRITRFIKTVFAHWTDWTRNGTIHGLFKSGHHDRKYSKISAYYLACAVNDASHSLFLLGE